MKSQNSSVFLATSLQRCQLADPGLTQLAVIVRGADTGRPELAPQAAGLLAVSLGLSALFADDHVLLQHVMVIYDALYAWCRSCRGEVHSWPPNMAARYATSTRLL